MNESENIEKDLKEIINCPSCGRGQRIEEYRFVGKDYNQIIQECLYCDKKFSISRMTEDEEKGISKRRFILDTKIEKAKKEREEIEDKIVKAEYAIDELRNHILKLQIDQKEIDDKLEDLKEEDKELKDKLEEEKFHAKEICNET